MAKVFLKEIASKEKKGIVNIILNIIIIKGCNMK